MSDLSEGFERALRIFRYNIQSKTMANSLLGLRFHIRTFGCQMNVNDSERLAGLLASEGAVAAESPEGSDLVLVNTCGVRRKSEEKLYSYLGRLSRLRAGRGLRVGVVGCVAQMRRGELLDGRRADFVVGPDRYLEILEIVRDSAARGRVETGREPDWRELGGTPLRQDAVSGYVTVMEGCDNFCAYCVVPYARGREKSRPFESVLAEVESLERSGYPEVQLLGQNIDAYRDPATGRGFPDLLRSVAERPGDRWVRFVTSHPRGFDPATAEIMAGNRRVCRALHLPVQAGSTDVLRRMNRGYTREEYLALVERIRGRVPEVAFSTDIIVGFPGETAADFEDTLEVLRRVRFANIFSFRYSPRPMTAAARLPDDVPPAEKARRLAAVQDLQREIQSEAHRALVGRTLRVLGTGRSARDASVHAGRTEGNLVVNFAAPGDPAGRFVDVTIEGFGPYSLKGTARS